MTGRGWHGEPGRHAAAARGIPTVKQTSRVIGDRNSVIAADVIMEQVLSSMTRFDFDKMHWQMSVREQDKFSKQLDDIIERLGRAKLPGWMDEEVAMAKEEIEIAWASKEQERILTLEVARERLHNVITSYLKFGGKGLPGPPLGYYTSSGKPATISAPWEWRDR